MLKLAMLPYFTICEFLLKKEQSSPLGHIMMHAAGLLVGQQCLKENTKWRTKNSKVSVKSFEGSR